MEIYLESMTKLVHKVEPWKELTIRCWRQEENYTPETNHKNAKDIGVALSKLATKDLKEIAEWLLQIDRMNAVEVIDQGGFGIVLYKDWP